MRIEGKYVAVWAPRSKEAEESEFYNLAINDLFPQLVKGFQVRVLP